MKNIFKKSMSLDVYADIFILPVCTSFVENAADLGQSWQTRFTPPLCKGGFFPKMILPYGAEGDLVIFQLDRVVR